VDNPKNPMMSAEASGVETSGLSVQLQRELKVASLRYFDAAGPFAAAVCEGLGGPLPEPLRAVRHPRGDARRELILAWRSPTETLLMTADDAAFAAIEDAAQTSAAGCMVDQTGGLWPWRMTGARSRDVLLRLGSTASIPALGEARMSRVAELPVMALCASEGELLLVVERVYSDHLLGWITETARDL
jgi:sarcosine oxidase gamma subunit